MAAASTSTSTSTSAASTSAASSSAGQGSSRVAPTSLLGKGWRHVESFDELTDDEYEEEEEVEYVTFDLGIPPRNSAPLNFPHYRLIGLDTSTPYLQLGNTIYLGSHERLVGSEILLRDQKDPARQGAKHVTPLHLPAHRIRFREITFKPRTHHSHPNPSDPTLPGGSSGGTTHYAQQQAETLRWQAREAAASVLRHGLQGQGAEGGKGGRRRGKGISGRKRGRPRDFVQDGFAAAPSASSLLEGGDTGRGEEAEQRDDMAEDLERRAGDDVDMRDAEAEEGEPARHAAAEGHREGQGPPDDEGVGGSMDAALDGLVRMPDLDEHE